MYQDFHQGFPEFLEGISQAYGDRAAISWFTRQKEEQCLTYRQVTERVYALREALCAQGLAGKRIAIAGENSCDWILVFLAAASCGCVSIFVDIEQPDESIRDMLRRSDAQAVFLSKTYLPICQPLLHEEHTLLEEIMLMGAPSGETGLTSTDQLLELGRDRLEAG